MDVKLTLKLNKAVIEKAKAYAATQNRSLSRLVEAYLKTLTTSTDSLEDKQEISPFVDSMRTGVKIPASLDAKKDYINHLEEKYG